jgi:hypothetical protein
MLYTYRGDRIAGDQIKITNEFCVKDLVINELLAAKFICKKVGVQGTDAPRDNTGPMIRKIAKGLAIFHWSSKHI